MKDNLIADLSEKHEWKGNILQREAEINSIFMQPEEDVLETDMTDYFLSELKREVINKEIIKIQINAKPRMGKSTVGIALGKYIFELLKKEYPEMNKQKEFGVFNIARTEQEFAKKMRNPNLMYNVIVTDERNPMDETGINATVESAQKNMYSDVQAGRYVHTVLISPEKVIDDNADIRLVVRNREKGYCHCRLFYKLNKGGFFGWTLIGYVDLNVKGLIRNWEKTDRRFMRIIRDKQEKGSKLKEEDKKFVDYWVKKDFYIDYMYRKFEKMELMNKEGIMRERELDYAGMMLNVINKMKYLAGIMSSTDLGRIAQSYMEKEFKDNKIPLSILGAKEITDKIMSVVSLYKNINNINVKIKHTESMFKRGKLNEKEYKNTIKELKTAGENIVEGIQIQEEDLLRYKKLNEKYHNVLK